MSETEEKFFDDWFKKADEKQGVYVRQTIYWKNGGKKKVSKYVGDPYCANCGFCLRDTATLEICKECIEDRIERALHPCQKNYI